MKKKTRLFAILAVFALVVAACGDDDGGSDEGTLWMASIC